VTSYRVLLTEEAAEAKRQLETRKVVERAKGEHEARALAPHGHAEAVDVTGAGDTVISAFTLALAARGSFTQATAIANIAGGLVVMKRATATVSAVEVVRALDAGEPPLIPPERI